LLENLIITDQKEVFMVIIACRIIHLENFLTREQRKENPENSKNLIQN
jgi:hypothetical protein